MNQDENDMILVKRVQNGDKQAFNLLVEKYQFRIKHLVSRFIKNHADQEDIVQESFIKAYRAISRFRGDSAFYTWLYGDKQAFNLLVEKYQFRIKHLVSRFIKNHADQEDIVQESFIKAYRAISRFRGDSAFYTWLYRIAVNTAKNYLVTASRRPTAEDVVIDDMVHNRGDDRLVEFNSPEVIAQNDQLIGAINRAINTLSAELKETILLRELDGLSYEDIAMAMNCPIGTVRSRIFRAREAISHAITDLV